MHRLALAACDERVADYVGRAARAFAQFGDDVEATDGLHFCVLLQEEGRRLWPARAPLQHDDTAAPVFTPPTPSDGVGGAPAANSERGAAVIWAARGVEHADAWRWMTGMVVGAAGSRGSGEEGGCGAA